MRDLERLHDVVEYRISGGQLKLVFLGVLAVACGIFAVGVSVGKRIEPSPGIAADPLAELDRATASLGVRPAAAQPERQESPVLTYHDELTERPTRARELAPAPVAEAATSAGVPAEPIPSAPDPAMPSPPEPAPEAERIGTEPAQLEEPRPGESAVYTLQVASFETREEANQFATDLRTRGHRVFLVRTSTEHRGTWYRVRVGPFDSRREATAVQQRFERQERLPTFLVRRER